MKFRRRINIGLLALCLMTALLALYVWRHSSAAAPVYSIDRQAIELPHRLRNSTEHDLTRSRFGTPYVLQLSGPAGALLYYGASHSQDPKHAQIADITRCWDEFKPTVALCEGRTRRHYWGALIEPFAGLPEPALVHKLAARDGIRLISLEPAYNAEVSELIESFDPRHVALYFFLRVYASESGGVPNEQLAIEMLAKRTDVDGLRTALTSLGEVDEMWASEFADTPNPDWRRLNTEPIQGVLGEISTASRRIRGEHMTRVLLDLLAQGERVFAVVGSGHVIRQEWNLRQLLGAAPSWDHPALD